MESSASADKGRSKKLMKRAKSSAVNQVELLSGPESLAVGCPQWETREIMEETRVTKSRPFDHLPQDEDTKAKKDTFPRHLSFPMPPQSYSTRA